MPKNKGKVGWISCGEQSCEFGRWGHVADRCFVVV